MVKSRGERDVRVVVEGMKKAWEERGREDVEKFVAGMQVFFFCFFLYFFLGGDRCRDDWSAAGLRAVLVRCTAVLTRWYWRGVLRGFRWY